MISLDLLNESKGLQLEEKEYMLLIPSNFFLNKYKASRFILNIENFLKYKESVKTKLRIQLEF